MLCLKSRGEIAAMATHGKGIIFISLILIVFTVGLKSDVEFPLVQSLALFPYFDNSLLNKKQLSIGLKADYSNIYSVDFNNTGVTDFEISSFTLSFRYGISDGFTLELYYRYFAVCGGFLDGGIEAFHDFFNLPSARRDNYPSNTVNYFFQEYFLYNYSTGTSSPLVFSVFKSLGHSRNFNLSGRLFLGIPLLSKPGFVSDRVFWGGGVLGTFVRDHFRVEASVYTSFIYTPEWLNGESLKSVIFIYNLELGYRGFLAGLILKTSPFKSGYFSSNAHQLYIGYRFSKKIEIGIVEDLPPMDTTPDVGFYIKLIFSDLLKK
jgi:hypothetical protein